MTTLVLGATGYVGSQLVPRLVESGHKVHVLVRDSSGPNVQNVTVFQGDALDQGVVESAMAGVEAVVYLIHSMKRGSRDFEDTDRRIAENVAVTARRAGVRRIIYLGGLGRRSEFQTPHLRSRHLVADTLRRSGLPVTELRAAVIVGAGSASFEMIKYLVRRLPVMICPRWVNVRTQPIAIGDVLNYLVGSLDNPETSGQTIDIGGPDILSYREMMLTVARRLALRRLIIPVPVLTPWLSSHWVNLVTPVTASLARALIESVRSETVCENDLAYRFFDFTPSGFAQAVDLAVKDELEPQAT